MDKARLIEDGNIFESMMQTITIPVNLTWYNGKRIGVFGET